MISKSYEDLVREVKDFNGMLAAKTFHVQAEVFFIEKHKMSIGAVENRQQFSVEVKTRVIRVFRGDGVLKIGDEVHFTLSANLFEESYGDGPAGFNYTQLKKAEYAEMLFDRMNDEILSAPGRMFVRVDRPFIVFPPEATDMPVIVARPTPMQRCPRCGLENAPGYEFCMHCACKLETDAPKNQPPPPVQCPKCLNNLPSTAGFCGRCGTKLGAPA